MPRYDDELEFAIKARGTAQVIATSSTISVTSYTNEEILKNVYIAKTNTSVRIYTVVVQTVWSISLPASYVTKSVEHNTLYHR